MATATARVDRRHEHRRRREPGRGRAALPHRAGRDLPPVGMDARREDPAAGDLPDPTRLLHVAREGAGERPRRSWRRRWTRTSPGAGARRCRCSWARPASSASASTRIAAACAGCRTCSTSRRAHKLSFTYHAYHEDAFRDLPWVGQPPRSGACQHRAHRAVHVEAEEEVAREGMGTRRVPILITASGRRARSRPRSAPGTSSPTGRRR